MKNIIDEGRKFPLPLSSADTAFAADAISAAVKKTEANLAKFTGLFPDDTTIGNVYHHREPQLPGQSKGGNFGWTTSFWTGILWLSYELSGEEKFRKAAEEQVESFYKRIVEKEDCEHHDLGFLYTLSCVSAYKLTGSEKGREAALLAADHLMGRYFEKARIIQAWGNLDDPLQRGRIIIDCLMNLPLLYWASEETGISKYREAAAAHAENALKCIVREDASTFHTFFFDPETGAAKFGKTHQGYGDGSCWARGQAWGVYGFPLSFLYTDNPEFMAMAEKLANYFLNRTPEDGVVYWDLVFSDADGEEKDSSASAIAACGLLEMAKHAENEESRQYFQHAGTIILKNLYEKYSTAKIPESNALLLHSVYAKPENLGVDEASLWGDYFYLEGLARLKKDWKPYW
ncbi:glycoside hydrolase family 88 protein [Metabacillus sp. GX 13764]|uniref:glycoside hydrolase family 88 protein n=1 Tax=Metabacillus kandeliae TaxID=2900151 RepID=UPI001E5E9AC0|nr:glycoside hydrolase family 88 protein [Metabacillus kandeliae]MCD7035518.1 glycoside hydrolase family 88 protein [Metabacillus kandeliae]